MKGIARAILNKRWLVLFLFAVALAASILASTQVKVNFKLSDYLPPETNSTRGLRIMEEEFKSKPSNLRVMLPGVSVPEALAYKEKIAAVPGVKDVTWLDDAEDILSPLETIPQKTVDAYYKDGAALISAYLPDETADAALSRIREIVGEGALLAGDSVQTKETRLRVNEDVKKILVLAVPIIFVLLLLATTSLFEPVLFLATIGVAILLGKGTDLLFGSVSFITNSCSAILQLAISMDYAIFLLEAFEENRRAGQELREAMANAMVKAFSAILSSALTTVMGFAVMILMEFKVGRDMGLVLAKDITLSLLCVLVLLPCLTIVCCRLIDATQHRSWMPKFEKFGRFNARASIPIMIVLTGLLIVPGYLASQNNTFIYGTTEMITDPENRVVQDQKAIEALYKKSNQMVLLLPGGDMAREQLLADDLEDIQNVSSVIAYASMADTTIPVEFVGGAQLEKLIGPRYDRMIITAEMELESERAFRLVEQIRAAAAVYYPDGAYLTGGTSNIYDMRETVIRDDALVNRLALASIGLVLLLNFKSLLLPFVLLSVIKSSIYVNLAVPYFAGQSMYYMGNLIINAIQLGATVDYAILFTTRYLENRAGLGRFDAAAQTVTQSMSSILTSAGIMLTGGLALGKMSSVEVVSELGVLVGRGAGISAFLVLMGLPALLILLDPLIRVTMLGARFHHKDKSGCAAAKGDTHEAEEDLSYEDFMRRYGA